MTLNGTLQWSGADHLTVKGPMRVIGQSNTSYPTGCSFTENTDYATLDGVTINMSNTRGSSGNESTGCYIKGGTNYVTIKNSDICCNIGKLIFIEWSAGARTRTPSSTTTSCVTRRGRVTTPATRSASTSTRRRT